jgi:hypothetical protein
VDDDGAAAKGQEGSGVNVFYHQWSFSEPKSTRNVMTIKNLGESV